MKKFALLAVLFIVAAVTGRAQESRQDISVSGSAMIEPHVSSSTDVQVAAKRGLGALFSYRFMLTPRGAVEANFAYTQNNIGYHYPAAPLGFEVNNRTQEYSAAYVYNFNYHNFSPFVEAGGGGMLFGLIRNAETQTLDAKSQFSIGALYGGGVAYEISPSFDVRLEYRGFITKVPNFGYSNFSTNRYYNIDNPVIGVAYHF